MKMLDGFKAVNIRRGVNRFCNQRIQTNVSPNIENHFRMRAMLNPLVNFFWFVRRRAAPKQLVFEVEPMIAQRERLGIVDGYSENIGRTNTPYQSVGEASFMAGSTTLK